MRVPGHAPSRMIGDRSCAKDSCKHMCRMKLSAYQQVKDLSRIAHFYPFPSTWCLKSRDQIEFAAFPLSKPRAEFVIFSIALRRSLPSVPLAASRASAWSVQRPSFATLAFMHFFIVVMSLKLGSRVPSPTRCARHEHAKIKVKISHRQPRLFLDCRPFTGLWPLTLSIHGDPILASMKKVLT